MIFQRFAPGTLSRHITMAVAILAVTSVLLTSIASWFIISGQQRAAISELSAREAIFQAEKVGDALSTIGSRFSEMASNSILATGLVDSAGKDAYLTPFLMGSKNIDGIPIDIYFSDFRGVEIASTGASRFTNHQINWLRGELKKGIDTAIIVESEGKHELMVAHFLRYPRTPTPEGALFYKVDLDLLQNKMGAHLSWDGDRRTGKKEKISIPINTQDIFKPLHFKIIDMGTSVIATSQLPAQYGLIAIASISITIILLYFGSVLAVNLTGDLRNLEAFSRKIVELGFGRDRAPTDGSQEIASLARSINHMLDNLKDQHTKLQNDSLKIQETAAKLSLADKRKDEFLAMLAHELRNPLSPISSAAQLLKMVPSADPIIARTSDIITRQVDHMTNLIDDLLDVSRVTRGLIEISSKQLDLNKIITAAVEQIAPAAEGRHHVLVVKLPSHPVHIKGDRTRLIQIFSNLLNNAAKFTPEHGEIAIELIAEPTQATVRVSDNGMGITKELLPELFGLFTQGQRSSDRSQGGLGLGLALVKSLVNLHGGQVAAHSDGSGKGSTFTVVLPTITADQVIGEHHEVVSQSLPAMSSVGPLRIMIVDDNIDAAQTMAMLLQSHGHQVTVKYEAVQALEQAKSEPQDLFVLDIGLPDMDGRELVRCLKCLPHLESSMFIALTGYNQEQDRILSKEAGFDYHFAKPFDHSQLDSLLTEVKQRKTGDIGEADTH